MGLKRVAVLAGVLCFLVAALAGVTLVAAPGAEAAGAWTTERIYSDAANEVFGVRVQGDYVVWTTHSRSEGQDADLFVYSISTKQTKRIAGRDLAFHVDSAPLLDGTHVVWEEYTGDDGSDIILYDIVTQQTERLNFGAPDTFEFHACLQGDWVVWEGMVTPGPGDWVYERVVFAYRISTSGPVQIVRWRDHETQAYSEDYRSSDNAPWVSNGKMAWTFERPDGGSYLGIMNLATEAVEWQWKLPAGHTYWPCYGVGKANVLWNDYMLIRLASPNPAQPGGLLDGLWLRNPGQTEPEVLRADAATYTYASDIRGGVAAWTSGDVYYKKPGGQVTKLANTTGAMDLTSDGSCLVWSRQAAIWWYDISTGESVAIPGGTGGNPAVAGTQVAWSGDYASGSGYHGVYLATRGGGGFPDVTSTHPYYAAISGMASRGIIGGYANGNFGPNDLVTRQQFAKMIVKTLDLPVTGTEPCPFVDVTAGGGADPFYPVGYVAVCAIKNITKGIDATHFAPGLSIKRAQMITMIVRAADNLAVGSLTDPPSDWGGLLSYADPTHGANIRKAEFNGLLTGITGPGGTLASWNTTGNATRGEVAQMLWNLLAKMP
jgi:hypothetical protein